MSLLYNSSEVYDAPYRLYDGTLVSPPLTVAGDGSIRLNQAVIDFLELYMAFPTAEQIAAATLAATKADPSTLTLPKFLALK